jgi:hypothetical protein
MSLWADLTFMSYGGMMRFNHIELFDAEASERDGIPSSSVF